MTRRPSRAAPQVAVVLAGDQRPMPREQGVRCHDGPDLRQRASTERLGFRGQADSLIVGEPEPPRSELLAQHAVLLLQIVDDVALLLVDPAGQRDKKKPKGMPERNHAPQGIRAAERPSSSRESRRGSPIVQAVRCRRPRSNCWTLRPRLSRRTHRMLLNRDLQCRPTHTSGHLDVRGAGLVGFLVSRGLVMAFSPCTANPTVCPPFGPCRLILVHAALTPRALRTAFSVCPLSRATLYIRLRFLDVELSAVYTRN